MNYISTWNNTIFVTQVKILVTFNVYDWPDSSFKSLEIWFLKSKYIKWFLLQKTRVRINISYYFKSTMLAFSYLRQPSQIPPILNTLLRLLRLLSKALIMSSERALFRWKMSDVLKVSEASNLFKTKQYWEKIKLCD